MRQIITFNNKNVILPEPWVQPGPPNDEIWYTSSDGNIMTPYIGSFPTIISNTYVDGKGIIKCASNITSIGYQAFYNRPNLTSVTIPNSVTSIEVNAFRSCTSLPSITIPNSVTNIERSAFQGCTSLTSISYTETIAQYNTITKGTNWHVSVPATVVHCTDGDAPI